MKVTEKASPRKPSLAFPFAIAVGGLIIIFLWMQQAGMIGPPKEYTAIMQESSPSARPAVADTSFCPDVFTPSQTEGPYYKTGSPERNVLVETSVSGIPVVISGTVFDADCTPLKHAWLDFWQADGNGIYDNGGYALRGHQYTDDNGVFRLKTVIPGEYPGRTPHIHVKVKAQDSDTVLTSQLYFPGKKGNSSDTIFNSALLVSMTHEEVGVFHFKLPQ